jgi:hypothetical protein
MRPVSQIDVELTKFEKIRKSLTDLVEFIFNLHVPTVPILNVLCASIFACDIKRYNPPQYDLQSIYNLTENLCFVLNTTISDHHEITTQQMREYEKGQHERKEAGLGRLKMANERDDGCKERTGFSAKDPRADAAW